MTTAFISIGSNVERDKHTRAGCDALRQIDPSAKFSTVYEAEAVGYDGENYYNLVAIVETELSFLELQSHLKAIEAKYEPASANATRQSGYRRRCLDLDIIVFGDERRDEPHPLPRPDLYKFAFVLKPMSELAPDWVVVGESVPLAEMWQRYSQQAVMQQQSLWATDFFV